jgi:hypothetical protein
MICRIVFLVSVSMIFLTGCRGEKKIPDHLDKLGRASGPVASSSVPSKSAHRQPAGQEEGAAPAASIKGEVLEAIDASRYTYIHVQTEGGEAVWTAVPQIKLSERESVEVIQSVVMRDFESKTLGRVFPMVVFGVLTRQKGKMEMDQKAMPPPSN